MKEPTPAFKVLSDIETQIVQLERAQVLLGEAVYHNESLIDPGSWEAIYYVAHTKPIITVLIDVAVRLVDEALPVLNEATSGLLEMHKKMREECCD